ncbi:autotransporter assembly complex protein TamA [Arenimonas fontis]|uniref:Translocation and assembly module subunit TamA n=1 Tax=Arenimonas fontis TaxID=2608255 RepID=A0A5B2Z7V7_9GAMM|nr:autotransporter assembly complex family protein [Arenimonas fontis]KAA2284276.1 outer membrane protein assembly factor [Arenimonas fontis]
MRPPRLPAVRPTALLLWLLAAPAAALELRQIEIQGLEDPALRDNVAASLSLRRLDAERRARLSEGRLAYLLRRTPREARQALEPFGYYAAEVELEQRREGGQVDVIVRIRPGEPVRVGERRLEMTGEGHGDEVLQRRLQRFRPREAQVFDHAVYERSKADMDRVLAERGYFDARLERARVSVNRARLRADLDLAWDSGARYALGEARFGEHPFRPGLLEKLVPWQAGQPYDQAELLALRGSLVELDYFAAIDLQPRPEEAEDGRVPVQVDLAPAKRSVYDFGLRYGSDTGLGLSAGLERRWVNDRGHKLRSRLHLAQRRNDLSVQYRIPAFAWLDGWYSVGASARQEKLEFVNSDLIELVASRSGRLGDWNLLAALNVRRERFEDPLTGDQLSYSTLVYPSLWGQWGESDDPLYPRRAHGLTLELRGGHSSLGSDVDFLQARAEARWIRGIGRRDRLLLRAEAGATWTDQFPQFPPSLRFYAGGDRSVRGYGYKEIGPFLSDDDGNRFVFGGKHLLVASAEYERMFTRQWGLAAFVDAGDAFDAGNALDLQVGAGLGLRWRSPVGPVRVDLAHGFGDKAQQSVRLHLVIGPDL